MANIHDEKSVLEKIVVNSGFGRLSTQPNFADKILPELMKEFAAITGQYPRTRPSKKSIAGFKIRAGQVIGLQATLRGRRMAQFLERVSKVVFPRIRDFRGIPLTNIDTRGNLNIGIKEQTVFPEIVPEQSRVSFGVQITVVPQRMKGRDAAIAFYRSLGVPLKKDEPAHRRKS